MDYYREGRNLGISMWKLSERSKQRCVGIDSRIIEVCDLALQMSPIDFGIPEYGGLRTEEQQNKLYLDHKSRCDGIRKKSYHQSGNALDFYAYVDGAASWDEYHLTQVAAAFLQAASELGYKLQWGGHFRPLKKSEYGTDRGWDMPHIQLME